MKTGALTCLLTLFGVGCGQPEEAPLPQITLEQGTAGIRAELSALRNLKGIVICALSVSAEGFPEQTAVEYLRTTWTNPEQANLVYEVLNLPAGTYAISCSHDENSNAKLDTNLVGAPTEGYSTSNNRSFPTRPPTFDEASVVIGEGEQKVIKLRWIY